MMEPPPGLSPADYTFGEAGVTWPLSKHSNGYSTNLVVKSGMGKLFGFTVFNSKASTQYILLFDAATLLVSYGMVGRAFNTGCVLVNSSTANSKTVGSADCWFDAQYL